MPYSESILHGGYLTDCGKAFSQRALHSHSVPLIPGGFRPRADRGQETLHLREREVLGLHRLLLPG